eukprot:1156201-Pelagomonas_calceolata.AAC.1
MLGEFPLPTFFLQESFRVQLRPIRTAKSLPHMIPDRRKAVLFAAARVHLNNENPTWLQDSASDFPKAKWLIETWEQRPHLRDTRHAVMPGIGKCKKLPLDNNQIAKAPHKTASDTNAPTPYQSNPNLQLEVAFWDVLGLHGWQLPERKRKEKSTQAWGRVH